MAVMKSEVLTASEEYRRNRQAYEARIADLHARRAAAAIGGPERARQLHKERKQLLPRERIAALLDPGSPFLEFCQLAGEGMYEGVPPGGSIVTGVGMVPGRACMVIANDATVKGGTYYGITCKKHVRAQRFAWQHRLPCVTMVQSGGANLPDQPSIFPDEGQFGSIFYNQIRMSSEGIPQIAIVHWRRLHAGAVRRNRHRPKPGRDVPGWTATGLCRDQRRGRDRSARRRRDAQPRQRRHRLSGGKRQPRDRDHPRHRRPSRRHSAATMAGRAPAPAALR